MRAELYMRVGQKFEYVCTGDVGYHDLVISGGIVGVASKAGVSGDVVVCEAEGVFALPKPTTGETFAQGDKVYVKDGVITATETGATYIGLAWEAATETTDNVKVKINA